MRINGVCVCVCVCVFINTTISGKKVSYSVFTFCALDNYIDKKSRVFLCCVDDKMKQFSALSFLG